MAVQLKKIDLLVERSELVQEVLERRPNWLISWGNSIMLFIVLIMILFSCFIKYPDIIVAKVTLTNDNPPIQLISKATGSLQFLVKDNELVKKNQAIGYIKNEVSYVEINSLMDSLKSMSYGIAFLKDSTRTNYLANFRNLGGMHLRLNDLRSGIQKLQFHAYHQPIKKEILSLDHQLSRFQSQDKLLLQKIKTQTKQYELFRSDYLRDKKLFDQKVIAPKDLESKEKELLTATGLLENTVLQRSQNFVAISEIQTSLVQLKNQHENLMGEVKMEIESAIKGLLSDIYQWQNKYAFFSVTDGKISFFRYWQNDQYVVEGAEIATIIPSANTEIIGRVESPLRNSGKIKIGQRVNILLDSYPYEEFGPLIGQVSDVAALPRNDFYLIKISLTNGLTTKFNKTLDFKQEMVGTAEIITQDITLIERVFNSVTKMVRKN